MAKSKPLTVGTRVAFSTPFGRAGRGVIEFIKETGRGVWYAVKEKTGETTLVRISGLAKV